MSRGGTAAAVGVLLVTAAAAGGVYLWQREPAPPAPTGDCTAWLGDQSSTLSAAQAGNAALVAAMSRQMGLPARGATIGIATAMQESSLLNLDYGDRDSLGLFQQRPSQGWGTEEQVQDPYYASRRFYEALRGVDGWQDMEVTVAAQRVQRSAFPDAYATREADARLWASALRGYSGPVAVTCDVSPGTGTTAQAFTARVAADLGDTFRVEVLAAGVEDTWLDVTGPADDAQAEDAFAAWAVAVAGSESVGSVVAGGAAWDVGEAAVEPPRTPAGVAVRLLAPPAED